MTTIGKITGIEEKKKKIGEPERMVDFLTKDFREGYNSCLKTEVEVDVDALGFCIYMHNTGLTEGLARNNWTAKHFQNKDKNNSYQEGLAIATAIEKGGIVKLKEQK